MTEEGLIFNPPPGWPKPPDGWKPPKGWTPEPSWPDPPEGWQLWLPADSSGGLESVVEGAAVESGDAAQQRETPATGELVATDAERRVALLEAENAALRAQLDQVQQRFDVGLVALTDLEEARAGYDLAVAQRIADDGQLGINLELLSVLTGQPHGRLWMLKPDFPGINPEPAERKRATQAGSRWPHA